MKHRKSRPVDHIKHPREATDLTINEIRNLLLNDGVGRTEKNQIEPGHAED